MENLTKKIILILLIIALQACKSIAILPTNTPVKNVNIEALASKIRSNYPKVNSVRSRIKATYDNGKRKQQVIIQFRMKSKKKLWLSATMIIPIAKLLVTPSKLSFYEKFF